MDADVRPGSLQGQISSGALKNSPILEDPKTANMASRFCSFGQLEAPTGWSYALEAPGKAPEPEMNEVFGTSDLGSQWCKSPFLGPSFKGLDSCYWDCFDRPTAHTYMTVAQKPGIPKWVALWKHGPKPAVCSLSFHFEQPNESSTEH